MDDIKNLISGLGLVNPLFYQEGEYKSFKTEDDYIIFLFGKKSNEIKDIRQSNIDFKSLEEKYEQFQIKKSINLKDINPNIDLYSKIDGIDKDNYFITSERKYLRANLNNFCNNKKRDNIEDVIYGLFGNYASGKTIFLIYFNYVSPFPSVYFNLKALKDASNTGGFQDLLNNELPNDFIQ